MPVWMAFSVLTSCKKSKNSKIAISSYWNVSFHLKAIMLHAEIRYKLFKYLNLSFLKISDDETYHVCI